MHVKKGKFILEHNVPSHTYKFIQFNIYRHHDVSKIFMLIYTCMYIGCTACKPMFPLKKKWMFLCVKITIEVL